jgi:hypothetical protein
MKAGQKIFIILLILSIVLGTFVLLAITSTSWVKQTNRHSTGVAWLEVCTMLETDMIEFPTPDKPYSPM